jgi:hypothetical protein
VALLPQWQACPPDRLPHGAVITANPERPDPDLTAICAALGRDEVLRRVGVLAGG